MGRLALVTARELSHPDDDRPLLDSAFAAVGITPDWVVWDDLSVAWARYDRVVVRSPWDYTAKYERFLDWVDLVGRESVLVNPAPVVRWNSHKAYLGELAERGVPVVPTVVVAAGTELDLAALLAGRGWPSAVVKPAVSVGAIGARRVEGDSTPPLVADVDLLVQPFVPAIAAGETSVVFAGGEPTHAVRKVPAAGDYRVQVQHGGHEVATVATPAQIALGRRALAAMATGFAAEDEAVRYARVDCVDTDAGPLLMELELIEPSLFLHLAPPAAAARFVDAVLAR